MSNSHPQRTTQHDDESVLSMRALNLKWQPSGLSAGTMSVPSYWYYARSNGENVVVLGVRMCSMRMSGFVARFDFDCSIT